MDRYEDAMSKAQEILYGGDQEAIEQLKKIIEEYEKH